MFLKNIRKNFISVCDIEEGDYFFSLFVRPKKVGLFCTILDLKKINKECFTYHFKTKTIK